VTWSPEPLGQNEHCIIDEADNAKRYIPSEDRWQEEPSIELALAAEAGISGGLSYFVPSLLLGLDDFLKFTATESEPDLVIDKRPCRALTGVTESGSRVRVVILRTPICILQVTERFSIRTGEVEQVTTYSELEWNGERLAADFS
jgi:hypothetical protein